METYKKLRLEKSSTDGYDILLLGFARSPFRDFEGNLRIVVGLHEDDIQVILKQNNANFVTYELDPSIHTIEDPKEAVYTMGDHEGTLKIEYDDITEKTKLLFTRSGSTFETLRFDDKIIFYYFIGFYTKLGC